MTAHPAFPRALPFLDPRALGLAPPAQPTRPVLELRECEGGYALSAEIPDLDPHELSVRASGTYLEIEGQHRSVWRPRLCFGEPTRRELSFARRFTGLDVDPSGAEASFAHGRLEIWLPKSRGGAHRGGERELVLGRRRAA